MTHEHGPRRGPSDVVRFVARLLGPDVDPGIVASLRRLDPDEPITPTFWGLYYQTGAHELRGWWRAPVLWAHCFRLQAFLAGLHDRAISLGAALALAGLSELRFERLLRARGEALHKGLQQAVLYLRAQQQACNHVDLLWLLASVPERDQEFRIRLAGDFYRRKREEEQVRKGAPA